MVAWVHFFVGLIGAFFLLIPASVFWNSGKKTGNYVMWLIGIALLAWASAQWLVVILVLSALIFVWSSIKHAARKAAHKSLLKRREGLGIPANAELLTYQGGNPNLPSGQVSAWADETCVYFTEMQSGQQLGIPRIRIQRAELKQDVQSITTGGGRSLTGAVVGDMVAGPVGAIVGSRKSTKTRTIDRSTVHLHILNGQGAQVSMVFKGGQSTYNQIAKLIDSHSPLDAPRG